MNLNVYTAIDTLTAAEIEVLREHNVEMWGEHYTPSVYIDDKNGKLSTPSCESVEKAELLRSASCKIGHGYYDGQHHSTYAPTVAKRVKAKKVAKVELTASQVRVLKASVAKDGGKVCASRDFPWNTIKSLVNKGLMIKVAGSYRSQVVGCITVSGMAALIAMD